MHIIYISKPIHNIIQNINNKCDIYIRIVLNKLVKHFIN